MRLALPLVAITTFVLLLLFTGSVVQPLRALVLNMISLGSGLAILIDAVAVREELDGSLTTRDRASLRARLHHAGGGPRELFRMGEQVTEQPGGRWNRWCSGAPTGRLGSEHTPAVQKLPAVPFPTDRRAMT